MLRRGVVLTMAVVLVAACGSDESSPPDTTLPQSTGSTVGSPTTLPEATATTTGPTGNTSAGERFPGFDIERVRLFGPGQLPEKADELPIPVPWSPREVRILATLDGQDILHVTHEARFYPVLEAFYGTWFDLHDIPAVESSGPYFNSRQWVATVVGVEVTVVVGMSDSGDSAFMEVLW